MFDSWNHGILSILTVIYKFLNFFIRFSELAEMKLQIFENFASRSGNYVATVRAQNRYVATIATQNNYFATIAI